MSINFIYGAFHHNHNTSASPVNPSEHKQCPPRHIRGCKHCREIETKLGPGDQTHPVSLNCAACGQFWRWMGRLEHEDYQRKIQKATAPRQLSIFEGGEGGL